MAVYVPGLVAILVFYLVILAIGIWAARKAGIRATQLRIDDVMLANRSIGLFIGSFTMTATWVGGGYINGSTEVVAFDGLVWCQAPIGYSLSLLFGGFFFATKMRSSGFITMLDPFHWKYGDLMNCLLYIPALSGDVFWSASILASLGATLKVVLELDLVVATVVSAAFALCYTLVGGLYSVAYTDVVQLICIFIGLWICVPFAMLHDATLPITTNSSDLWYGTLDPAYIGNYVDFGLLLIFGGIPWQVYWQRALAAKTVYVAKTLSILSAVGCVIMAVPAVLMGAVAASTDWNQTEYGSPRLLASDRTLTLPLVMRYLCPTAVTFIGLGAVSAAVMSSTDSSILSSSCMFARNVFGVIYTRVYREKPSETKIVWVMRVSQVVITAMSCAMAISVNSIYYLFLLCSDFVYVILFPQLVCVMYLKGSNSYGSLSAFVVGLVVRLLGGEKGLSLPATIIFPWYDTNTETQLFPFRTMSMLLSLFTLIVVSYTIDFLFRYQVVPLKYDFYRCFQHLKDSGVSSTQLVSVSSTSVVSIDTVLTNTSSDTHCVGERVSDQIKGDNVRFRGSNSDQRYLFSTPTLQAIIHKDGDSVGV